MSGPSPPHAGRRDEPEHEPDRIPPGKKPPSIATRLARSLLASSVLWCLVVSLAVWLAVRHEVDELLDDTLQGTAEAMRPIFATDVLPAVLPFDEPMPSTRYAWQVVDYAAPGAVHLAAHSRLSPLQPFVGTPNAGFARTADWRVFGISLGPGGRMLYVAQSQEERLEAALEVGLDAALATLAVALLVHLWMRWRAVREFEPVRRLSQRLEHHDLLAPGATLGPAERVELVPVHAAIDGLAAQLARRLANERAFSAHAAHALRTPLAGIDAQLAVALRESPPELRPRLQRARAAAGRLQKVVASLLALFRSGVELHRAPVDLAGLINRLPLQDLEVQVQADRPVRADADLLTAALLNLLDNSARHGAARVRLSTPADDTLLVHDDGPGVDADRLAMLRAAIDDDRLERHGGLGLKLVLLVMRAHGGRLSLPDADAGFAVRLDFAERRSSGG